MTTREDFARALCAAMGWATSQQNLDALVAWQAAENTEAAFNPLATTEGWANATDFNSAGVKNYASLDDGLAATRATLTNGLYGSVISSFSMQQPAAVTGAAIDGSPWGTKNVQGVVADVVADRTAYYLTPIGGGEAPAPSPAPSPAPVPDPSPVPEAPPAPGFAFPELSVALESQKLKAVEALQAALVYVWGYVIAVDGLYGPVTEGAVKAFQRSQGLAVDGIAGPLTLPKLYGL
ncbi:MAG: peptidoglycan-binding protein [Actinomycetota bacterium]|nr:peptidoglycan-binding protein [Actinomycetota bacterium]